MHPYVYAKKVPGITTGYSLILCSLYFRLNQAVAVALPFVNHIHLVSLRVAEYVEAVAQKLHLNTCILGLHGFNIKLLGPDNFNLVLIRIIVVDVALAECLCGLLLLNDTILILL